MTSVRTRLTVVESEGEAQKHAVDELAAKAAPGGAPQHPWQRREGRDGKEDDADPGAADAGFLQPAERQPESAPHGAAAGHGNRRPAFSFRDLAIASALIPSLIEALGGGAQASPMHMQRQVTGGYNRCATITLCNRFSVQSP